jgi:hypothetical protein
MQHKDYVDIGEQACELKYQVLSSSVGTPIGR